jgi:hypothetical protein
MYRSFLLVAAFAFVGCHHANEDQTTATPSRGDTTAVTHAIDTTRTGPPGVAGRPGNATITADSAGIDSTAARQDTMTTPSSTPQDTVGPR